jgi:hypothetical protein
VINEAIDRWADSTITDKLRMVFSARALEGIVRYGALVT